MNCPHCSLGIELVEVRCGILRCGIYKLKNGKIKQLPKHAKRERIEHLRCQIIIGCGNPIKYSDNKLVKCSWEE